MGSRIPVGSDDGAANAQGGTTQEATATDPRPHLADGRYVLDERLGGGGTADVYRALDTRLNRSVAIKLFRPGAGTSAEHRFREEAQLLGPLEHPCLVTVYDAAVENGRAYVVLQLIDGVTLGRRLVQGPLNPKQVVEVGARLADVLAYVHSKGIVHRDVKPSNVLVDETNVYLADFGISRLLNAKHNTASGLAVGTAAYMAPEQVRGLRVGPAADVYSLGLVLLECLTGRVEYPGSTVEAAIARLSRRPRISAGLPAPLRHVLCAMTETDPERRPTAARCANALAKARMLLAGTAPPPRSGRASGHVGDRPERQATDRAGRHGAARHAAYDDEHAETGGGRHAAPADEAYSMLPVRLALPAGAEPVAAEPVIAAEVLAEMLSAAPPAGTAQDETPADGDSSRAQSLSAADPGQDAGGDAADVGGALRTGRRRFVHGRRRAEPDCLGARLGRRVGVRGRIGLGIAAVIAAIVAGAIVSTPTRPLSSATRPGSAVPPAAQPDVSPSADAPVTLPVSPDDLAPPSYPADPTQSAAVPSETPPASPTPSTYGQGLPIPTPSVTVPSGGQLTGPDPLGGDLAGDDDGDFADNDDGDFADSDDGGKPVKVKKKPGLFALFLAWLASHDD